MVIPIDLTDTKDVELLVESLQAFVKRKVPIRFGIVPCGLSLGAQEQSKVIYYLLDTYGLGSVFTYLEMVSNRYRLKGLPFLTVCTVSTGQKSV